MKKRNNFLCLILVIVLTSCYPGLMTPTDSHAADPASNQFTVVASIGPERYIGLIYPPYPDLISIGGGMVISPSQHSGSWVVETVADDYQVMLWLSKVISHDADGKATFQVSDITVLPPQEENLNVLVSSCLLYGTLNPEIVALVRVDEETKLRRYIFNQNVILTWRANQTIGRLEKIDTESIECHAESFLGYP